MKKQINKRTCCNILRLAFFTDCKEKRHDCVITATHTKREPAQHRRKADTNVEEYKNTFLQPRKYQARMTCRLDCEVWEKLNLIVRFVGNGKLTIPGLVNNILQHHIEMHREGINKIIKNFTINI